MLSSLSLPVLILIFVGAAAFVWIAGINLSGHETACILNASEQDPRREDAHLLLLLGMLSTAVISSTAQEDTSIIARRRV